MISDVCDDCTFVVEKLRAQAREREEALVKSDRVRGQLRTTTETLQKRLAQTQQQLRACQQASTSCSVGTRDDSPTHVPSNDPSCYSASDASSPSQVERVRNLLAEVTHHRRRSELSNQELHALHSEVSQRRRQSQVDEQELVSLQKEVVNREAENERFTRELEHLQSKLSLSEALSQDRLRDLETLRSTWVTPAALQQVKNELAELKAKEEARVQNPVDALDALQRDLEDAASWRKASMGDAQKKAHLTLKVAELQDTTNRLVQENAQYKITVRNLEEEASGLRTACQHSTSSMVQRYDDLRNELTMLRDERRDMYARMGVLEEENKVLRTLHDAGNAQRMESELQNRAVEIERLRQCNAALCSQLFGDETHKANDDSAAIMLLQGQRPMVDEDEHGDDIHIKTIIRLQQNLTNAEEKHLAEKEQLMEKVRMMERNAAARLAPLQKQQREQPKEASPADVSHVNSLSSLVPTRLSAIGWSFVGK